jgi:hypothetical protein
LAKIKQQRKMPLNLQGFVSEPNQWAGLYHAADQMEKRQLRQDQLAAQKDARKNSTTAFLQNYLDPKDYLTGTQMDPLILQGIDEGLKQGSQLVNAGADNAALMVAMTPIANKLHTYSSNAKSINKQVDDQLGRMKADGLVGYDYSKLHDEALKNAFYKPDASGKLKLDPDQADPSVKWVDQAIENSPELVTSSKGWDQFADKSQLKTETHGVKDYDRFGTKNQVNVNLKFQEHMVPEWDAKHEKVTGFVPKYQSATDGGQPLMHVFTDASGNQVKDQVRLLDKSLYEGLSKDLRDDLRGKIKQHLKEYQTATGQEIAPNSPQAESVGRALAYDELNRPQRNRGSFGDLVVNNQLSPQMVSVNVQGTDKYLENERKKAEMHADVRDQHRTVRTNPVEVIGDVFNGDHTGAVPTPDGLDITGLFPGGGLKAGRGQNFNYKGIFFNPDSRSLTVEKEAKQDMFGRKLLTKETIPENEIGQFIYKIGEANGVSYPKIKEMLKKMGYSNKKFKSTEANIQNDFDRRDQGVQSWNQIRNQPFGLPLNQ